jgi:hypothetical protein
MATQTSESLVRLPDHGVAYVAVVAALVSAGIHLYLAPRVIGFSQTTGVLFYLNGIGWLGGIALLLSRFWRRELYLVAAGYAVVTVVAFVAMGGQVGTVSIVSKLAEVVVAVTAGYLYTAEG